MATKKELEQIIEQLKSDNERLEKENRWLRNHINDDDFDYDELGDFDEESDDDCDDELGDFEEEEQEIDNDW